MTSSYERRISDRIRSRSPTRSNDSHRSLRGSAYADDKQRDRQRLRSRSLSLSRKRSSVSKSRSPPPRNRSKSPRFRSMRSPIRRNSMQSPPRRSPRRHLRSRSPYRRQARQARPSPPARLPKGRSPSRSPVRKSYRTTSPIRSPRRLSRSRSRSRSRSPIPHSRREKEQVDRRGRVRPTNEARQSRSPKKEGNKDDAPKPNFGLSGKLAADTNSYNGVVLKYFEPPEARKPTKKWRLYVFKGSKEMGTFVKRLISSLCVFALN